MERDVLQVFASTYVAESDIPTEDKLMLIDYIRECDEFGVMYLLSTGEMLGENEYLDEKACGILFEQYQASLAPLLEAKPKGYYKMKGAHIKTVAGRKVAAAKGAAMAAGTKVKGAAGRAGAGVKGAAISAGSKVKGAAISAGAGVKGAAGRAGAGVKGAAGRAGAGVKGAAFDAQMKLRGAKKAAAHQVKGAAASMKQAGAGAKEAGKGLGGALKSASKIPGAKPAAVVAAAAAASYAVYKRFFSAASKACAGKSGGDRSACIDRFKKQAKMAQVKELQKGMAKCGNDPGCRSKLQGKISKAKSNM